MRLVRPVTPLSAKLVLWFAFLGPLGNLIPVPGAPASFRFFYLMLPPGILIYLWKGVRRRTFNHILILTPVLAYMLCSAVYAQIRYANQYGASEENPVIRYALFIFLLLFTVCAGEETLTFSLHQRLRVLGAFMSGYLVSLFIGYIFLIGFYSRLFTLDFISRFEILVQWGYGLLRFSPGSYPNEYGVVSSFALSVLTLLLVYRRQLIGSDPIFRRISSTPLLLLSFLLTLVALFLTTTRAAYVSYILSVFYIGLSQGGFRKPLIFLARTALAAVVLLLSVQPFFDVKSVLVGGYYAFFDQTSFASGRLGNWDIALGLYLRQPYLGFGFGTMDMMHNVYLQMLFGLGIVGFSLLVLTTVILIVRGHGRGLLPVRAPVLDAPQLLLKRASTIALIHISWFALSNHNLNHFLTWLAVLLTYLRFGTEETDHGWLATTAAGQPAF
jgi:O-antigen ligase